MSIEIVMVSVDYADYLQHSLPWAVNQDQVSRVVVVTSPKDEESRRIAEDNGAVTMVTSAFFTWKGKPAPFNKAAGINAGLRLLDRTGWVLLLDSDIVLADPLPDVNPLDPKCLYHIQRRQVVGGRDLSRLLDEGERSGFPPCPIPGKILQGYFHLWHWPTRSHWQPEWPAADKYDTEFARRWPDNERIVLDPGQHAVYHLETSDMRRKLNWAGRKSRKFQ